MSGYKLNKNTNYRNNSPIEMSNCTAFDNSGEKIPKNNSYKQFINDDQDLIIFTQCKVEYELRLQIWNIDGRIIKDSDHRRVPIHNY